MKYHTQQLLYNPKGNKPSYGSCYPTVIACILDLELCEVPYFNLFYASPQDLDNFTNYLNKFYYQYRDVNDSKVEETNKSNWQDRYCEYRNLWVTIKDYWLYSKGYTEEYIWDDQIDEWLKTHNNVPYIAHGMSARNVGHVVVYLNGKMIHDPHPSREGLVKLDKGSTYTWLKPIGRPITLEQLVIQNVS